MGNELKISRATKAEAKEELFFRKAKSGSFMHYCLYMDYKFFTSRPFLGGVAAVLQEVYNAYKRKEEIAVCISLSPRSGKSWLTSLFCSFMLGHFPKESIMRNTVTTTLYQKLSKDTRQIIESPKWISLFGHKLKTRGVDTWDLELAKQCSYFGGGVGSTIIGFGASMLDITDDLFKDFESAMSENVYQKTVSWQESARQSRHEKGCCRIDIGTRWRTDDIIGLGINQGIYKYIISVPALNEKGESFCDAVNTTEHYMKIKNTTAEEIWTAEYMQEPVDIKGRLFAPDELHYFKGDPSDYGEVLARIAVVDTADEGSDNLSMPICSIINSPEYDYPLYYIDKVIFTKDKMELTEPRVIGEIIAEHLSRVRIESNNGGKLFAINVSKSVPAEVSWRPTTSHKATRILNDSAALKKLFRYRSDYKEGSEYSRFMQNMFLYTKEGKSSHDDGPDSMSMLRRFIIELGFEEVFSNDVDEDDLWESEDCGIDTLYLL